MKTPSLIILFLAAALRLPAQIEVVSGGNVGIGTSSPNSTLHTVGIFGVSKASANYIVDNTQTLRLGRYDNGSVAHGYIQAPYNEGLVIWNHGTYGIAEFKNNRDTLFYGNVGIGTTNPSTTLQVMGPITAGLAGGSTQGVDYLYGYYGSGKIFVLGSQYSSAASFLGYAVKAKPGAAGYVSSTDIAVGRSAIEANVGYVAFLTGSTQTSTDGGTVSISERVRIAQGGVGIGTASPSATLEVYQASGGAPSLRLNTGFSGGNAVDLNPFITGVNNGGFELAVAGTPRMVVSPAGNVGIGTTTPSQKLHVAGSVKATSFISDTTTYADFVFKPGYDLPALSEIEAHIKEHGHLPGIPSEAEARKHGIDLTAMQVKLLQKVEELTLHLIRLDKENAALRREVEMLKGSR